MKNTNDVMSRAAAVLTILLITIAFSSRAEAQCFARIDSIADLVTASKSLSPPAISKAGAQKAVHDVTSSSPSIVGLWHVHYVGPAMPGGDQEAYQIFNTGGTEVHNPNTPTDGVCLGAWNQTAQNVNLTHRVWLYDPTGTFVGVGHLNANITVSDHGATQTGTFTLQIFDLDGNPISPPFPGTISGERITPN